MKSYWDLTNEQQAIAVKKARQILVALIADGVIEIPETKGVSNFDSVLDKLAVAGAEGSRYSNEGNLLKEAM